MRISTRTIRWITGINQPHARLLNAGKFAEGENEALFVLVDDLQGQDGDKKRRYG
jgi:hypothetical protein